MKSRIPIKRPHRTYHEGCILEYDSEQFGNEDFSLYSNSFDKYSGWGRGGSLCWFLRGLVLNVDVSQVRTKRSCGCPSDACHGNDVSRSGSRGHRWINCWRNLLHAFSATAGGIAFQTVLNFMVPDPLVFRGLGF